MAKPLVKVLVGPERERAFNLFKDQVDNMKKNNNAKELFYVLYDEVTNDFLFITHSEFWREMRDGYEAPIVKGGYLFDVCDWFSEHHYELDGNGIRYRHHSNYYSYYIWGLGYSVPFTDYEYRYNGPNKTIFLLQALDSPIRKFEEHNQFTGVDEFVKQYHISERAREDLYIEDIEYVNKMFELSYLMMWKEFPQVELMIKTKLAKAVIDTVTRRNVNMDFFKRNFKKGKNLDEITMMPKWLWRLLLERDLSLNNWNEIRIWYKKDNFTRESAETILSLNLNDSKTLTKIRKLCMKEYGGKKLYTINSLINYLERVDLNQAIRPYESIDILTDYLRMCLEMNTEPVTQPDSLKKVHDVQVRNYNMWWQEHREQIESERKKRYANSFAERSEYLSKYEYSDGILDVVCPKSIGDMINEGIHNHNCVGSYVERYAKKEANIFFIRRHEEPEKSYITVELNGPCTEYRQALYGYNRSIYDKDDLGFIKQWLEHNKEINENNGDYADA